MGQTFFEIERVRLLERAKQLVAMLEAETPTMLIANQVAMVATTGAVYCSGNNFSVMRLLEDRIVRSAKKESGFCVHCDGKPKRVIAGKNICFSCATSFAVDSARIGLDPSLL